MAHRHMDRLTSFDTSFLANERRNGHMAIGAAMICTGAAPSREEFLAQVGGRLHLLPRFRQRLAFPPLGLGRPFWVDFPELDLDAHVRRASLPAPGGEEQFRELVGELVSPPLDRARPLWELWLVDGFADDRFGVLYKTHHALADGFSAVDIGVLLFDLEGEPPPAPPPPPWRPQAPPSRARLLATAPAGLAVTLGRLVSWLADALRRPGRAARRAADGLVGLWEVAWNLARPAPPSPFNVEIGPRRGFAWTRWSLADLKRIKRALGGTVNDVSLAVTAGALRRWLEQRPGVDPDGLPLRALVPVSVRTEDERGQLGNRLTAMRGPLPVQIADPLARLRAVVEEMDALKTSKQALGAEAIWGLNDWFRNFAPPLLLRPTAAVNFSTRLFNMLVTNFPGPQVPLYVLGRELTEVYPVGFLASRHALSVAIFSYNGQVGFGLLADRDAIEDPETIAAYVDEAIEELLALAKASGSSAQATSSPSLRDCDSSPP